MPYNERVRELKAQGYNGAGIAKILRREKEENYRAQVREVENLYRQGYTVEQVRAIGQGQQIAPPTRPTFQPPQPIEYTVTSNDTLSTIAQQFNTTEADLLAANPSMNQIKTGMVINTRPTVEEYRNNLYKQQDRKQLNAWLASMLYPLYIPNKKKNKTWIFGIPFDWNLDNMP